MAESPDRGLETSAVRNAKPDEYEVVENWRADRGHGDWRSEEDAEAAEAVNPLWAAMR